MTAPDRAVLPADPADLPPLGAAFWDVVDEGAAALGVELSPGARHGIDAHARLLLAWNAAINLTAVRDPQAVARRHVLDSLTAVPVIRHLAHPGRSDGALTLLDIGSGGGYPGLPVALCVPTAECALVDSVRKKARFLAVAGSAAAQRVRSAGETPPEFMALPERAEDLAEEPEHRGRWRIVVARAVGSLAEVVELAMPLVARGGALVAWKRDAGDGGLSSELAAAGPIVRATGGAAPRITPADPDGRLGLPGHVLVSVRKVRPTPARYPRPPAERRRRLC